MLVGDEPKQFCRATISKYDSIFSATVITVNGMSIVKRLTLLASVSYNQTHLLESDTLKEELLSAILKMNTSNSTQNLLHIFGKYARVY